MKLLSQRIFKTIALLLDFFIADVYALADARKPNAYVKDTATNAAKKMIVGRLQVPFHYTILVNGRPAGSGETIISGSHLQTPNFITAMAQIASVGELHIAPDTDLVVTFDNKSIEARVSVGEASLTTADGVKGQVIMPGGEVCPSTPFAQAQGQQPSPPSTPADTVRWDNPLILGAAAADIALWGYAATMTSNSCNVASPVSLMQCSGKVFLGVASLK